MVDYFKKTKLDEEFYDEFIRDRLPDTIVDSHIHVTKEYFKRNCISDPDDWSNQCLSCMEIEDYKTYASVFYPGKKVIPNVVPAVTKGLDVHGNNAYIAQMRDQGDAGWAHMMVDPKWSGEETEREFVEFKFDGFKPYPDFISGKQGGVVRLFDFVTHDQLAVLNKYKGSMILHLPRPHRFADDDNLKELLIIRDKYPDIRLVVAHCGRSYAIDWLKLAHHKLGDRIGDFYYDLAAVLNPEVLDYMFTYVPHDRMMYGTDLPIFLWHGRRKWTNLNYYNLLREDFPFNKHAEGAEIEAGYTFFLYEQLKNILDATDRFGGKSFAEDIFYNNATKILGRH